MFFRILWILDALILSVVVFFFFAGVERGTVSSLNLGIWAGLLGGLTVILGGSWFARARGLTWLGILILLLPALPALLYLLAILAIIILQPDWR